MKLPPQLPPRWQRLALLAGSMIFALALPADPVMAEVKTAAPSSEPAWVARSNENAKVLMEVSARFSPEFAGRMGVAGLDEEISDLKPGIMKRVRQAMGEARDELKKRLAAEKDPAVRQDLEILIQSAEESIEGSELSEEYQLPYFNVPQTIFQGIRALLDDQVEAERRGAALSRLEKYAGMAPETQPFTQLAMDRIQERFEKKGLLGPVRAEVERDLQDFPTFVEGIEKLFQKYEISGYEKAYGSIQEQVAAYEKFVREKILPLAREDFKQPPALYAFSLKTFGIDMPVEELTSRAKVAFMEIRNEMQALTPLVAKEQGLEVTDYRDLIRGLKKRQLVGEAILPHYQARIKELEALVRREKVATLPEREMRIRLASEAESASIPAPHLRPPRLVGNTGEMGEFVLPLKVPGPGGELSHDDFTYEAASWTLTVHEGRPGHELQFASLVEKGVSLARALYAFNSVNVEGWALYAESEMKPYLPLEGQFISLQHRLMRAARAFLDPGLQLGHITPEEARRILLEELVLSEAMANQEIERYTFRMPGQAPSYFCGYTRLLELRADVERRLGDRFNRKNFHDFILAQGLLPPTLLRKALLEEFVPKVTRMAQKEN